MISFLSRILSCTRFDQAGSEIFHTRCETPYSSLSFEIGAGRLGASRAIDLSRRIAVQHEELPKVGAGGP